MQPSLSGIKITLLNSTSIHNQQEYFFDSRVDYVVIGCDAERCHIPLPQDLHHRGIGAEHLALRRSLGRYQLDLNTDHYVEVNSRRPVEDMEITGINTFLLGSNVRLRVEVVDARPLVKPPSKKMLQAGAISQRNKRAIVITSLLIVMLGAGLVWQQLRLQLVDGKLQVSDQGIKAVALTLEGHADKFAVLELKKEEMSPALIADVSRSVYQVIVRSRNGGETPAGTAWVTDGGRLATNAHVVEGFAKLKSGEQLLVRSPESPYTSHVVTQVILHPGFNQYQQLWREYLPVQKGSRTLEVMRGPTPADVALIEVDNAEALAPPLNLASRAELESLSPGQRIAFAGYPSERLLPSALKNPVPIVHQNEILRMTDFFMVRQESDNHLIHHGLPITGGASGSPIFNASGKVIGLVSSGNFIFDDKGRTVNAANINFGQRLDFLHDLLEQPVEQLQNRYLAAWQAGLRQFDSGPQASLDELYQRMVQIFGVGKSARSSELTNTLTGSPTSLQTAQESLDVSQKGIYLITLKSRYPGSKLEVEHQNPAVATLYQVPTDMAPMIAQRLLLVSHPGSVSAKVTLSVPTDEISDDYEYTIKSEYWPIDATQAGTQLVTHMLQEKQQPHQKVVTLLEQKNITELQEIQELYATATAIEITRPGIYVFAAYPLGEGDVDSILLDAAGKGLQKDQSKNPISMLMYDVKQVPATFTYLSVSPTSVARDVVVTALVEED